MVDEGFSSQMTAHRDKGYGVVVLTNSNHPEFIDELIRAVALTYGWDLYVPQYKKQYESKANRQALAGRYKMDQNAMIEIYPDGDRLMSRNLDGDTLEFVKVSDTSYITRKSPRPIQFIINPGTHIRELIFRHPLADTVVTKFSLMLPDEKLPLEYVIEGNLDQAFKAYQVMQQAESQDPFMFEEQGYQFLNEDKIKLARDLFKINTMLHPNSANAFDSYAEACMKNKETELAILNYKKSLSLNPKNENAVKMIKELEGKK
jgi:tetratricopeptide (TPR) repeat protein